MTKFPLCWPAGWGRRDSWRRNAAKFTKSSRQLSVYDGTQRVLAELRRFYVSESSIIISTNVKLRQDGLPLSNQSEPQDPGVAVYWKKGDKNQVMATDRYSRVADNLAAIAATLDAMRAIERHGGTQILDRAFMGFTALPQPKPWHEVLGVEPFTTLHFARLRYRELATENHPDKGGNAETMAEINRAWSDAQRELGA